MNMRLILQKGLTTVEYVIAVSAIAAIVVGAFHLLGNTMSDNINGISGAVDGKHVASSADSASPAAPGSAPNPFSSNTAATAEPSSATGAAASSDGASNNSTTSTTTNSQDTSPSQGGDGTGEYTDTEGAKSTPATTSQSSQLSAGVTNSFYDGSRNGDAVANISTNLPTDDAGVAADTIVLQDPNSGLYLHHDGTVTFTVTEIEIIDPPTLAQLTLPGNALTNKAIKPAEKKKKAAQKKEPIGLGWPFWLALMILFPLFWLLLSRMFRHSGKGKTEHVIAG